MTGAVPRPLAEALRSGQPTAATPLPIAVRKYDGRQRFVVETVTLATTPTLLVARGEAGRRFSTAGGTAHLMTVTLEYFPAGCWYNVLSYFDAATGALAALRELRDLAARGVPPFTAEPLAVAEARVLAGGRVGEWAR